MAYRIPILFFLLLVVIQTTSAQTTQPLGPSTDEPLHASRDNRIVLETRWLTMSDDIVERAGESFKLDPLPKMGSRSVHESRQIELLFKVMQGDKRSNEGPSQTVSVVDGERQAFSLHGSSIPAKKMKTSILATFSNDRQRTQIEIIWPKRDDGTESLPATTASVPIGSHLLIATHIMSESRAIPPITLALNRLLNRKLPTPKREIQRGFLLISPRMALQGEEESHVAAK